MKLFNCECTSAEFLPDENQWEPGHQCEECYEMDQLVEQGLLSHIPGATIAAWKEERNQHLFEMWVKAGGIQSFEDPTANELPF